MSKFIRVKTNQGDSLINTEYIVSVAKYANGNTLLTLVSGNAEEVLMSYESFIRMIVSSGEEYHLK